MSITLVMLSHHLILCCPLLLPPSILPSIRVFFNEVAPCIRWPKHWNFSFRSNPSREFPGLLSFRIDWVDLVLLASALVQLGLWAAVFWEVRIASAPSEPGPMVVLIWLNRPLSDLTQIILEPKWTARKTTKRYLRDNVTVSLPSSPKVSVG